MLSFASLDLTNATNLMPKSLRDATKDLTASILGFPEICSNDLFRYSEDIQQSADKGIIGELRNARCSGVT